jgi:hypothetical protein
MESVATTTDNLENRKISAAEIDGVYPQWAYEGGTSRGPEGAFRFDHRNIILDLRDLTLADRDAVRFLKACKADGMTFEDCPAYVCEWMDREKH